MQNQNSKIKTIPIKQLQPHPDNPNRMSKANFAKLVRHIERTGRYEPLIVRPAPNNTQNTIRDTQYEIINGHHRFEALKQLGYEKCDCVVWDVDNDETALLLATLNRLSGTDVLDKKLALLKKLAAKHNVKELSKLLPNTKPQIERLIELQKAKLKPELEEDNNDAIAYPMVFFLNAGQKNIVTSALAKATQKETKSTKAQRNAEAITKIAKFYESSYK